MVIACSGPPTRSAFRRDKPNEPRAACPAVASEQRRNSLCLGGEERGFCACRPSVADAPLPDGASTRGRVSSGAVLLSRGKGEESSPAPSKRNAKNEHDRKPHRWPKGGMR